jgi:hypothetical protein
MEKITFVELFLVKHGQVTQEESEKIVKRFVELYPNKKTPDKYIDGVLGYIKHSQKKSADNADIADYMHGDILNSIQEKESGNEAYIPSTSSYWVEMINPILPKL